MAVAFALVLVPVVAIARVRALFHRAFVNLIASAHPLLHSLIMQPSCCIPTDAYADSRFSSHVDVMSGFVTRAVLCLPVALPGGSPLAVLQVREWWCWG